ncbi:hypothetical protein XENOCAPTIV_022817 [Xenoophorus captivus]|uniref:Uncharacterized protein n=1 Tax=Xenoophorus captivus TaxID=1517983 RepID=A0ABV0RRY6_9TELE
MRSWSYNPALNLTRLMFPMVEMDIRVSNSYLCEVRVSSLFFFFCYYSVVFSLTTRTPRLLFHPGPGRGGSRLSRDTETSLSPDTSSSSSGGSPRRSQASQET